MVLVVVLLVVLVVMVAIVVVVVVVVAMVVAVVAKAYRSDDFTMFIKLLGNQKVPGLIDKLGKHLTINDVLDELETIKPRIPALYMGGFIRDLIKNKRADDIDFSFATDPEVSTFEKQN